MATVTLLDAPYSEFADDNGTPLAGGLIYTYDAGTSNARNTYTDGAGTIQHPDPIVLDAYGRAVIYVEDVSYRFIVRKADSTLVRTVDPVRVAMPVQAVALVVPPFIDPLLY